MLELSLRKGILGKEELDGMENGNFLSRVGFTRGGGFTKIALREGEEKEFWR